MDPLSLSASIIAVLQMTATFMQYMNDVKDASADQKRITIELSNLYGLLTTLRFAVEEAHSGEEWFQQVKLLAILDGPLDQLGVILEKIMNEVKTKGKRERAKSALMWKWTKSEIDRALERIERLKSLIQIALSKDVFKLSQAIHDKIIKLSAQTSELQAVMQEVKEHTDRDSRDRLSRWLRVPDPSTNFQAALNKRHSHTGSWFLTNPEFLTWKSSANSLIWVHGNAGCGKTVLSATALEHILIESRQQQNSAVAYFYFDFNDVEKQQSQIAIRSLLFQFALQSPSCMHNLQQLYQRCGDGQQQPSEDTIRSLLSTALADTSNRYVVLDAPDECADRHDFLPFIRDALSPQQPQGLRIFVTSRREKDIEDVLKETASFTIEVQSSEVDRDIDTYVRDLLSTDPSLRKWKESVKEEIARSLGQKAHGMFRWAECQLDSLRHCIKLSALRKTLSTLPKSLDETYKRILGDIEANGHLSDAINLLQWLCFSRRPLMLSEVVEILAVERGEDSRFNPEDRLPDPEDVMTICSSLIIFRDTRSYSWGNSSSHDYEDDDVHYASGTDSVIDFDFVSENSEALYQASRPDCIEVRLAHFSVKEYILSDRCDFKSHFTSQVCHQAIMESCLVYLLHMGQQPSAVVLTDEDPRLSFKPSGQYPLARYAAANWSHHAGFIESSARSLQLMVNLLTNDVNLRTWLAHTNLDTIYDSMMPAEQHLGTPLYYAARLAVSQLVDVLLKQGADPNAKGGLYGNALQAAALASFNGGKSVVQLLLNNGADVNARGGMHGTALQAASFNNNMDVVQLLVKAGSDVNARGGEFGNALHAASFARSKEIIQILLDAGAHVNESGPRYGSALIAAVSSPGGKDAVEILLDAGINVNAPGTRSYGNALSTAAAFANDEDIIKLLLDAGANPNTFEVDEEDERNPLVLATWASGKKEIVQLLLDSGADVNAGEGRVLSAAIAPIHGANKDTLQLLIDAGADVNMGHGKILREAMTSKEYGPSTLREDMVWIVQLLLENGADPNLKTDGSESALGIARRHGYKDMERILLDAGAEDDEHIDGDNIMSNDILDNVMKI